MSGFSDDRKKAILEAALGGEAYEEEAENFLALVTTAVKGSDKGTSIIEPTYTGYGRIGMKNSQWTAEAEGKRHNNVLKAFAACTAGESTIRGWAYCTTKETKTGLVICSGVIPEALIKSPIVPEFDIGALIFGLNDT